MRGKLEALFEEALYFCGIGLRMLVANARAGDATGILEQLESGRELFLAAHAAGASDLLHEVWVGRTTHGPDQFQ
jgi:hypothetical protein